MSICLNDCMSALVLSENVGKVTAELWLGF